MHYRFTVILVEDFTFYLFLALNKLLYQRQILCGVGIFCWLGQCLDAEFVDVSITSLLLDVLCHGMAQSPIVESHLSHCVFVFLKILLPIFFLLLLHSFLLCYVLLLLFLLASLMIFRAQQLSNLALIFIDHCICPPVHMMVIAFD